MPTAQTQQIRQHPTALTYLKWAGWLVVLAGVARFFSYSIQQYNSEGASEGIVVCDETSCILTVHIHADIAFDLCGEHITLPRETGPLDGLHTHKEKNYLHFHDKVPMNFEKYKASKEKEVLFDKRLTLQEILDVFALNPTTYCGSEEVTTTWQVNGAEPQEGVQYNWKDGDDITLTYTKK